MRIGWLVIAVVVALPLRALAQVAEDRDSDTVRSTTPRAADESERRDFVAAQQKIVAQTQQFRQQQDLGDVEVDPQLSETAQYFAQYMAENDVYGHGADGRRPSQRAEAHGYDYCLVSENIAHIYSSQRSSDEELAQRFVEGWKQSPEHRENMLEPAVTEIGVGVAQSAQSGYYFAVQMFGRPESAAIRFEVSNQTQQTLRYELGERVLELPPRFTRTHQRCRSGELTFLPADDPADDSEQSGQTVQPRSGDQFNVVSLDNGRWQVQRQQSQ